MMTIDALEGTSHHPGPGSSLGQASAGIHLHNW